MAKSVPRRKSGNTKEETPPAALNLATIVYRLLTSPRGMRVEALSEEFNIGKRARNNYIQRLQNEFIPFVTGSAGGKLERVMDGEVQYIRLVPGGGDDTHIRDLVSLAAATHVAQSLLRVTRGTPLEEAIRLLLGETFERVKARSGIDTILTDLDRKFYSAPQAEKDYSSHRETIESLTHALLYRRQVSFLYESTTGSGVREVELEPYTLLFGDGAIYIAGRSRTHDRVIKLDVVRIRGEVKYGEKFTYPSQVDYNPSSLVEGSFGVFTEDAPLQDVRVVFKPVPWLLKHLQERNWHPSSQFRELADGALEWQLKLRSLVGLGALLFGLDRHILAVEPAAEAFRPQEAERGEDSGEEESPRRKRRG